jgi:hypothetical protein
MRWNASDPVEVTALPGASLTGVVFIGGRPQVDASRLRRSSSRLKRTTRPLDRCGLVDGFQVAEQLHLLAADQMRGPTLEVGISFDQPRRRGLAVVPLDDAGALT